MSSQAERTQPKSGEIWQHFGGEEYVIIAIATLLSDGTELVVYGKPFMDWSLPVTARHEETGEWLSVLPGKDFTIARPSRDNEIEIETAFALPLHDFMEILSNCENDCASNYYRFSLI